MGILYNLFFNLLNRKCSVQINAGFDLFLEYVCVECWNGLSYCYFKYLNHKLTSIVKMLCLFSPASWKNGVRTWAPPTLETSSLFWNCQITIFFLGIVCHAWAALFLLRLLILSLKLLLDISRSEIISGKFRLINFNS